MIRVIVDSGSSIKPTEKDLYNVDIIPIHISLEEEHYLDGVDLTYDRFYTALVDEKIFPKTALPSIGNIKQIVKQYLEQGDQVIIVTISSSISSEYNTTRLLYDDNPNVLVLDSKQAIGGIKLIIKEINKHLDKSLDEIKTIVEEFIPRIRISAVPDTLEYLHRGGRLSTVGYVFGSLLHVKPIITMDDGILHVYAKARGNNQAMSKILTDLENADLNYPIVPCYTYKTDNLELLISKTDEKYKKQMIEYDHISLSIASHWGPNGYGYVYVEKKN